MLIEDGHFVLSDPVAQWTTSETINAMAIIAIIQFNAVTSPNQRILAKSTSKTNQSSG